MHQKEETRLMHTTGVLILVFCVATGIIFNNIWLGLLTGILGCYFFAFLGHLIFEKNWPATFKNPLLSIVCDFKMAWIEIFD